MRAPAALLLTCLATATTTATVPVAAASAAGHDARHRRDARCRHADRRRHRQAGGFAGQTIRVEGVVTAVCAHMGCWMTLAPAGATGEKPATLRLKVDDGVIVFPVSARGKTAVAQGVIERVGGDPDAARSRRTAGTAIYQLKVTGAVLR